MSVPINTTANGRRLCQRSPWEGGGGVERARSPRMLGEYGLYLVLKDGHFHVFQVLIKVFFFFFWEKPTRTIALSKKYPRSPCVAPYYTTISALFVPSRTTGSKGGDRRLLGKKENVGEDDVEGIKRQTRFPREGEQMRQR